MEKLPFIALAFAVVLIFTAEASQQMDYYIWNTNGGNDVCAGIPNNTATPNEVSCTEFFNCVNGQAIPGTCPPGQWFNPVSCECDSTPNPDCNPSEEFKCPKAGIWFFPHENCEKFIMCFNGTAVLQRCAEDLHFDRELGQCNFPEYAECLAEVCPPYNDPHNITFIPSDVDCEKYYICYSGEPLPIRCAPGIHFNAATGQCDFPENANCTIDQPPPPPSGPPQPEEIECRPSGIYFVPHPNSCAHYFICCEGESLLFKCAPTFWFEPLHNWCDAIDRVQCSADDNGYGDYVVDDEGKVPDWSEGDQNAPAPVPESPFIGTDNEPYAAPIVSLVNVWN